MHREVCHSGFKDSCSYKVPVYSLNTVYLQKVASQKDLGITVSNTLTPTLHIRDINKKAHRKIAMFHRCFTGLDEAKVSILYQSLVRPALEYASTVWSQQTKNRY